MQVRRAAVADHAAVGQTTVTAYGPFLTGAEDFYIERLRDAAGRDRDAELWVAVEDSPEQVLGSPEQVLGSVTICPPGSPWREVASDTEGEFRMLAVAPHVQRRGVGDALLRLVLRRCAEDGAHAVVMSSLAEMTSAHRLYDRHGFSRVPDRDWSPAAGVELVVFRRPLIEEQ